LGYNSEDQRERDETKRISHNSNSTRLLRSEPQPHRAREERDSHIRKHPRSSRLSNRFSSRNRTFSQLLLLLNDSPSRSNDIVESENGNSISDLFPSDAGDAATRNETSRTKCNKERSANRTERDATRRNEKIRTPTHLTTPAPATLAKGTSLTRSSLLAALMTEAGIRGTIRVSETARRTAVVVAAV